ncbi:hypothetical protein BGP_6341 [Beggiatoa sp. PS]|nr:hypothetical protein BGP_6341 [Beggiatoa sp. PS]
MAKAKIDKITIKRMETVFVIRVGNWEWVIGNGEWEIGNWDG